MEAGWSEARVNPRRGGAGRRERSARWSWLRDFVKLRGDDNP